jgi:hypothetical protein
VELLDFADDTDTLFAQVSNKANGTGYACVDLPGGVNTTDSVKMTDHTDPNVFNGDNIADGYDLDWVGACYLYLGDETAWGAACYDGEGTRFVDKGNWGTFFQYEILVDED